MKTLTTRRKQREALLMLGLAVGLTACGGGGSSGVRPTPPAPAPAPAPGPAPAPPPTPPADAQLSITHADLAHAQGFTGAGVLIGIVDSGIMENHPALAGRVTKELIYVDSPPNNTSIDDVVGHGTWVSEIAAGTSFDDFAGGVAPGANLLSARIISDTEPVDDGSGQGNQVTAADADFFSQTLNPALIAAGVQVMNNSWGGIYWDTTNSSINQAFAAAYEPFVLQHDGLVVFAAGNDSKSQPSDIAMLPTLAPQLEKGWLVAVAVDSNHPTQLASYSNACGPAMNYCLAAPGNVIVSGKDDTTASQSYYIVEGTSFAAPQVSGAAALVWQAFPYFNNDLVRQTLLGTADDLGAPGVDATFGYGELDVGRAVNGPAKFDWGDVTVNFTGDSSWNNPISGAGGLIKQGAGTLTLTQPSTYTGDTNVQGGALMAKSLAGNVNVSQSGTLALSGGDVTVAGNYTQSDSGHLAVSLGSVLRVAGTAAITGGDLLVTGKNSGYVVNSHTDVLDAAGGLTGVFSGLDTASNVTLNATIGYDAHSAWLNVQQVNVTQIQGASYTAASYGAAQRVQGAFEQINSQLSGTGVASGQPVATSFIVGAANIQQSPSVAAAQQSLESLSGQLHAASTAMTFEAIDAGTRALSDRFDALLDKPLAGAWTQNLGYHGGMSRNGYSNVGYDLSGVMIGQDERIGGNGYVGYALNQSNGLGRLAESADQGRSHALEGMLYGGVINGSWYTMGRFGMGDYRENIRRFLQLGSQEAGVASDSNGSYSIAYGESGYRMEAGHTEITPYVNLQYAQVQRDGFDEQGADGFGLKADGQTAARWQAGVGLRAMRKWTFLSGGSLSLQTRLLWQQSFGMRGEVFDASFTGLNQFAPLGGVGLARYGGVIGSTLNWSMTPRASLQIGYDQYVGQGQESKMGTASFNWSF
ncbi:autotransporter serine protease [Rhodanobacter sp. L36]|uniref:autotransporter serine protease n=1 Tax=Rhodanobacter sp. L36 TaxID=1747221 RepID=UPI00131DDF3E|nr:autotransporter serine protease [Rhodanobacter sp. L36]